MKLLHHYLLYPIFFSSLLFTSHAMEHEKEQLIPTSPTSALARKITPCKTLLLTLSLLSASISSAKAEKCFPKVGGGGFAEVEVEGNTFINNDHYVNTSFRIYNSPYGNNDEMHEYWRHKGDEVGIALYLDFPNKPSIWAASSNYEIKPGTKETIGSFGFELPKHISLGEIEKVQFHIAPNPTKKGWDGLEEFEKDMSVRVKNVYTTTVYGDKVPVPEECQEPQLMSWAWIQKKWQQCCTS